MGFYRIADLPLEMHTADTAFFTQRLADYVAPPDEQLCMTLVSKRLPALEAPPGETTFFPHGLRRVRLADGRYCNYRCAPNGRVAFQEFYTPDYSHAEFLQAENCRCVHFTPTDLEYMYTGSAFSYRLKYLGGGVLHSSAIAYRGKGVAFTADSGTGKSTHTGLWLQQYPAEVSMINDDKPAIRFLEGKPYLFGTPWSGKTSLNANVQVPLKTIVCLHRGSTNTLRRLEPVEALFWLSRQIYRPYFDKALGEKVVSFTQQLAEQVPVYELHCTMEPEAAELVRRELFE